jgi:hypothetical protein
MRYHILQHGHLKTKVILYQLVARIFGHGAAPCSGHQRKVDASPTAGDRCANGTSRLMVDGRFQLTPDRRPAGAHAPEGNPCHDPLYRGGHQWWSGQDSSDISHRRSAFWITAVAPVSQGRATALWPSTQMSIFSAISMNREHCSLPRHRGDAATSIGYVRCHQGIGCRQAGRPLRSAISASYSASVLGP